VIGRPVRQELFQRLLVHRAAQLGIAHLVTFETDLEDRRHIYAGLGTLLHLPRRPEPFGTVLLEAMALGVPVVAAMNGGTQEIITHGETGLMVPPGDVSAAARALQRLTDEPGLADSLRWNAEIAVQGRLSLAAHAEAMTRWITRYAGGVASRP
jgi:glycosyltransferase involved in cell wall biosynthesis